MASHICIRLVEMANLIKRSGQGEYAAPKTVLGFYGAVLAILEAGVIGTLAVLATNKSLHYLIPWVCGFGALILMALIVVVVAMNIRDPSKLQLGQVTAREYIEVQRMTLGDSIAGAYTEEVPTIPASTSDISEGGGLTKKSLSAAEGEPIADAHPESDEEIS